MFPIQNTKQKLGKEADFFFGLLLLVWTLLKKKNLINLDHEKRRKESGMRPVNVVLAWLGARSVHTAVWLGAGLPAGP